MKSKITRQVALLKHLVKGGKLSIKNSYLHFGISNISREVVRLVEVPLGMYLVREKKTAKTKYGTSCYWFEYTANERHQKVIKKYLSNYAKS